MSELQPPWFVYLVECDDGSYYAGITLDLHARLLQHQQGRGAAYTRAHPPLQMLAARPYPSKGEALSAEYALKQLKRGEKLAFFEPHEFDPLFELGAPDLVPGITPRA